MASDSESARTYYHYACDSLGSVDFVLAGNEFECDEICGDVKQRVLCRYKYDAFGNVTDSVENVGNRFGFAGEMLDDVTGQYYLRARYYVPETGRFTQADTFHGDGLNLYVYAGNNPVRYVDPEGHAYKDGSVSINPHEIRFSQSSVNGSGDIIESMKKNGWKGEPIDVVKMPDGRYTTIDNTRVVSARIAGINVEANVHEYSDLLPDEYIERFTTKKGVPKTWGEAIELRVGKQRASFRKGNPYGKLDMETIN